MGVTAVHADFTLRPFQAGDETHTAALFNCAVARGCGPCPVTPESWLEQYHERSWRGPGLSDDPDCFRVAQQGGRVVGYCVTDYHHDEVAIVQELCVAEGPGAETTAQALLEDAEARGRERGKSAMTLLLSPEDGFITALVTKLGYEFAPTTSVFMTLITDLAGVLRELQPELTRRLRASAFRDWSGTVALRCGPMGAALRFRSGHLLEVTSAGPSKVTASSPSEQHPSHPDFAVDLSPEVLPLLIFGRTDAGQAYLQDRLHLRTGDTRKALQLLDALFPRLPMYLPRAQWW